MTRWFQFENRQNSRFASKVNRFEQMFVLSWCQRRHIYTSFSVFDDVRRKKWRKNNDSQRERDARAHAFEPLVSKRFFFIFTLGLQHRWYSTRDEEWKSFKLSNRILFFE